jgi:4-hydroxybutyrate dehydrogenase
MILSGYQKIVAEGEQARISLLEDFLIASNYAGIAFGTAGCAAVHALSYPLSGQYHVAHGESNYAMFTGVLKNYLEIKQDGEIAAMNLFLAGLLGCDVTTVYEDLERLLNRLLPKKALREYGVTKDDLQAFTDSVMVSQGRLMGNNFVPLDAARVLKIYTELY